MGAHSGTDSLACALHTNPIWAPFVFHALPLRREQAETNQNGISKTPAGMGISTNGLLSLLHQHKSSLYRFSAQVKLPNPKFISPPPPP